MVSLVTAAGSYFSATNEANCVLASTAWKAAPPGAPANPPPPPPPTILAPVRPISL
jgi:hypothetical protein